MQSRAELLGRGQDDAAGSETHQQLLLGDDAFCSCLVIVMRVKAAWGVVRESYLLVSSLMMFQSRGKILSFIKFLNMHRIFNKKS